jgi:YbgC/YbaW family acyl-CoA thioester hydrolase
MAQDEVAAFGVEGEWAMARRHVVRWVELDAYGHVNNAAYLTLCEDLRVGHWSALGGRFAADAPGPVVAQLEARFLRSLAFEDKVLLTLRTTAVRRTSYTQDYAIWKQGPVFTSRAVMVVVRQADGARIPVPPEIRAAMLAEGAKDEAAA